MSVVYVDELHELHIGFEFAVGGLVAVFGKLAEYAAYSVGEREEKQLALVDGKHIVIVLSHSQ